MKHFVPVLPRAIFFTKAVIKLVNIDNLFRFQQVGNSFVKDRKPNKHSFSFGIVNAIHFLCFGGDHVTAEIVGGSLSCYRRCTFP